MSVQLERVLARIDAAAQSVDEQRDERETPPLPAYDDDEARLEREAIQAESARPRTNGASADPLSFIEGFIMTEQQVEEISSADYIEPGLFPAGHVIAVPAPPNGGKTTIMFDYACKWADRFTVCYLDMDTNPADAKTRWELARRRGFRYATPDAMHGVSIRDVVQGFERLAASDADLGGHVFIFDTLKKISDVINKTTIKATLTLMRALSMRGATIILLCHTNKFRDSEGNYVFEGTGDVRADVDEMIFFEPLKNDLDGSLRVSTRCDKQRAAIGKFTWVIDSDRCVTQQGQYLDVRAEERRAEQREKDQAAIEVISEFLAAGVQTQSAIVDHCAPRRLTRKVVRAVLKRYRGQLWLERPATHDNALEYTAIPRFTP
jgi:hypothetical protein